MIILGLSTFADSSAAIIKDGKIICAVEEERLNRIKHFEGMPWLAIKESLSIANISMKDIDMIAIGWNPLLGWKTRIVESLKSMYQMPEALSSKISRGDGYIKGCRNIFTLKKSLRKIFTPVEVKHKIKYVTHHFAHAASAFLVSPYEHADIVVADGIGESATISFFQGDGIQVKRIGKILFPHSLGHMYASVTGFLGFRMTYDEGKVMALAAFGEDKYRELFLKVARIHTERKTIEVNTSLLDYHAARNNIYSRKWLLETGLLPRKRDEPLNQKHKDLACSLQKYTEEIVFALLHAYFDNNSKKPLCAAGGLFLNSVLNGNIVRNYTDQFFIQPASGDNGVSVGAALSIGSKLDNNFQRHHLKSASLGKSYSDDEVRNTLLTFALSPRRSQNVFAETAEYITQGKIIGWFRGGMEYGPRALGNRSIFACPTFPWIKDAVNNKVKHRESFRPFGGLVLLEEANNYFENVQESPFMFKVFHFKEQYRNIFPAITHIDYSCRIQTVDQYQNQDLYTLLEEVKKRIGYGIILNTSMNIANSPIVNTPTEAIELIRNTDLDVMVLEDYIILKEDVSNHN